MSARLQEGDEQRGTRMPKRGRERLYLVFDDWCHGYSIRMVNLLKHTAGSGHPAPVHFSQPFCRIMAPLVSYFTSAFGAKILAVFSRDPEADSESYFPMLDVRSQCVTFAPGQLCPIPPIYYLPVGNELFCLSFCSFEMLCSEVLSPRLQDQSCSMGWSWKQLSEKPPFYVDHVTSYSLHPEERTFLFSTKTGAAEATYTFDTQKRSWKLLGNWKLPFAGCAHFDPGLNCFVGLSKEPDTLGQIYSCQVPIYDTDDGLCPPPVVKLCKENLLSERPRDMHVGATLVYMGGKSEFCLVQCVSPDQDRMDEDDVAHGAQLPGRRRFYRLTTFSLSFNKDKELTTGNTRRLQYYKVPKEATKPFLQDPVAFWM
ncbi:hypothetical protein CFC21_015799 [Triticum aestivum]|nr:uncharacterized protein LOC119353603 [Triticum dicoccoides]XP_044455632.1 uncharacterized protein LOC123187770 [Triticum aestivum]KAF6999824.1 hypothetical protein CFC21_015799 [Triticum aestivum]